TVSGFSQLVTQFPDEARFVVWLNPYWGPIEHQGKRFTELKAYGDNKERVSAIVEIPLLKEQTFGRDLSDMLQSRLTFDEAIMKESLSIMSRQRLKIVRGKLFDQFDELRLVA
ncbi:MAG: conjugal transfer protein TraL, partial [Nitrosospira sp.]